MINIMRIELSEDEISELEKGIYNIEDWITDFKDKDETGLYELFTGEYYIRHLNSLEWLINRTDHLTKLLKSIVQEKYYTGYGMFNNGLSDEVNYKIFLQKKSCSEWNAPYFAPEDGVCFNCGVQIYEHIPLTDCILEHITHCPVCSRAYND